MSTAPKCPQCQQVIAADDVNVARDLAYCRRCNLGHGLSDLIDLAEEGGPVDLRQTPAGTWYVNDPSGVVLGASHRSWGRALGLVGISLFWNGIVSVFVLFALSGTLLHLNVAAPDWFPAPKMKGGGMMSWGMVIFLWIFLTPFIVIGSGMLLALVSTLAGKTEVRLAQGTGGVFVGIGRLGWTRRFDARQVKRVEVVESIGRNNATRTEIWLEEKSGKVIKFGSLMTGERQQFLARALRQVLR